MEISKHINISSDEIFEQIFNCYWVKIYAICMRYTLDEAVSKDLTQNIFLSLWESSKTFTDYEGIEKYLSKAAKYQVSTYIRNKKNVTELSEDAECESSSKISPVNPEIIYITKEQTSSITQLISELSEPGKTIFLLNREQKMSYNEIAHSMGITVKTVQYHISKVLIHLRTQLSSRF